MRWLTEDVLIVRMNGLDIIVAALAAALIVFALTGGL